MRAASTLSAVTLFAVTVVFVGCESRPASHTQAAHKTSPTDTARTVGAAQPSAAAAAAAASDAFEVEVEAPSGVIAGKESMAKVRVEPNATWHMNLDFPVKLNIVAPAGVEVSVPKQRKADAERFDDEALVFALPFVPQTKGGKHFQGEVEFAVCGNQACLPQKVAVDFIVEVGCGTDALC